MKFTAAFTSLVFLLPMLAEQATAAAVARDFSGLASRQGGKGGFGGGKGANANGQGNANQGGNNNNNGGAAAAAAASSSAAAASASASAAAAANAKGGNNNNNGGASSTSGGDQASTTLDQSVIATGFALDGQQNATAGQVASLTSTNNFINFCATVSNLPITNGQQITTGSCNPAPMGVIAASTNIPSSKFTNPKNLDTIAANQDFTVTMAVSNLETGNFVNAASNYYSAPQQVNAQGNIVGHTHIVIEQLDSLTQTTPTDPTKFAFFKGVDGAAVNGAVSVDVTGGLPAGTYRMASINSAANHQPVLVAIAQHGSCDDQVYFTVGGNGAAASGSAASAASSATSGAAAAASSSAAASTGKNAGKGGNKQKGGRRSLLSREMY
ncbi:uncharacterized protein STEHIDRAFT_141131 [Stereum hirsutum FP-91666 SS1]|uniref:uncharacterized protein n=1 Tax=Stereum hirsutum (strain FP-91666) TaxID=721885 RepID=UPI000444A2CB|nr:uncharacterized protein STEHIDRAFT_141131 [Stereum hirsutum FP-91666 SS1]EIM83328.1 hypothetical protein STEHIDRAFT_141131 [Stereum hirsutum FP-91666 SS1]